MTFRSGGTHFEVRYPHERQFCADKGIHSERLRRRPQWIRLSDGTRRWGELRREVDGISEKMLASTLRTLASDGLVHREAFPSVPPHVEYSLTPLGVDLMERMLPLVAWVADNADGMLGRQGA